MLPVVALASVLGRVVDDTKLAIIIGVDCTTCRGVVVVTMVNVDVTGCPMFPCVMFSGDVEVTTVDVLVVG